MNFTVINIKRPDNFLRRIISVIAFILMLVILTNTRILKGEFIKWNIKSMLPVLEIKENDEGLAITILRNSLLAGNIKLEKEKEEEIVEEKIIIGTENIIAQEVQDKNITPTYSNSYGTVTIKNSSDYQLTEEMLIPNSNNRSRDIIIYHTHTCESYTPSEEYQYAMTGNYRTTDYSYNIARVGDELSNILKEKNFNVTHDKTYHDYPAYSGSYERSLQTVEKLITGENTIILDLHRDAVGSSNEYAPTVKINGKYVAQLMFVIGTSAGGLEHPNWNENLKFAIKVQEIANEIYPGLFRPILLSNSRYNQHISTKACIIEVGATGNTLEQCLLSMQCLANVLEKIE